MNESPSAAAAALSGTPGSNLSLIATLLRDSIIHLCKVSKIYDGWIEIDGIICISGQVEGQQLVVKVHESFRPQEAAKKCEGGNEELDGNDRGFGYEAERSLVYHGGGSARYSERKRKRVDSASEIARSSSSAFRQSEHHVEMGNISRSFEADYKNGATDLSMKKSSAAELNSKEVAVGSNTSSTNRGAGSSSSSIFPYFVGSPAVAYQVDEMMQVSYSEPGSHIGSSFFRPRSLGMNGERWNVGRLLPECRVCGCSFESSESLSDHNEAVHSLFTCLCCFKTFTSRSNLERHSRLHTGHKPYTCSVCNKAFSRKDHLSNHATKHAYKCGTCSKRYADRGSLISHYHLDHCAALTNICAYCNKGFSSQEAFEDHVKIHPQFHQAAGEPDEAVEEKHEVASQQLTGKGYRHGKPKPGSLLAFYKHRSLLQERANHALYTCLVCNRSFDHPWKYSSHLATHPTELNVFKCCMCLQVCSTLAHLRQHEAAHFSELSDFLGTARLRPFPCGSCDQTFDSAYRFQIHLEEHQRMNQLHLGEFHQRLLCPKEQLDQLHQAPERVDDFTCGLCDVRFVDQVSLLRHLEENDHNQVSDDTKILKRGKRKQKQPKIAITVERGIDENSEIEVVEPESPTPKPLSLRRDGNSPERINHSLAEQGPEDTGRNSGSGGTWIRTEPIRNLMCSRSLALVQKDLEHENGNNGADVSKLSERPSLASYEDRNDKGFAMEAVVKSEQSVSSYPFRFGGYSSSASEAFFHSSESYRSFQRCRSSEGFQSVSTTPSDPGCLNNNNNNNVSSVRNENCVGTPSGPPYLCAFCDAKTETFSELDGHCQLEHSRSPCMFCAKTFAQKANRDRHHCLHTGDRPYGCPECDERFSRGDKLKMHRVRMHGVQYPVYSSRQKDAGSSSRDFCTSPSSPQPSGAYPSYEAFEQPVAFLGGSRPPGSVDQAEEGDDRGTRKGATSQGDGSEEEGVSERRRLLSTMARPTNEAVVSSAWDSAMNSASS